MTFILKDGDWLVNPSSLSKQIFRYNDRVRQTCIYTGLHLTCWFGELASDNFIVKRLRKISQGLVIITLLPQQPSYSPVKLHVLQACPMVTKIHPEIKFFFNVKKWRNIKKKILYGKVLNRIVRTLAAVSIPVCKVFIAPAMMLIWLYLAICCDVLKRHGEFCKS